jgi:hypothetical protein
VPVAIAAAFLKPCFGLLEAAHNGEGLLLIRAKIWQMELGFQTL